MTQDGAGLDQQSRIIVRALLTRAQQIEPMVELDQCPSTIDTVLKRIDLLLGAPLPVGAELLLLGDDDLLSIGLQAAQFPAKLTVVDADERILRTIRSKTKNSVRTVHADLRQELPRQLSGQFNIVFTDPPYTLAGQLLFARSALKAVHGQRQSNIFICASDIYLKQPDLATLREYFNHAGFDLREQLINFNEYTAPSDVKADLERAGIISTDTFFSSLYLFTRVRDGEIQELPASIINNIYEYGPNYAAS